jgi:hypothetical protein
LKLHQAYNGQNEPRDSYTIASIHDSNRQKMYRYFQWIFQKLQILSGFWYKLKKTGRGSVRWRFDQCHTLLNDNASSVQISEINQITEQIMIQPPIRTPSAPGHDTNTTKERAKKNPKRSRTDKNN